MMLASRIEVSTATWVAVAAFFLLLGPLLVLGVRQMWRDDPRWSRPPTWWAASPGQWYAFVRMGVPATLALTSAFMLAFVFALFDQDSTVFLILDVTFVLLALGGLVLTASVVLLVRPRFMIPPARRLDDPPLAMLTRALTGWPRARGRGRPDAGGTGPPSSR